MSNEGPNYNELLNRVTKAVKEVEFTSDNAWRAAPFVAGGLYLRRPMGVFVATAGLAALAGPQVLDAARSWALEEINRRRKNR